VQREVPREAVKAFGDAEERLELAGVQVGARELRQLLDRRSEVVCADVRESLGDGVDLDLGQAERLARLTDGGARAVGLDHRDAGGPVVPVAGEHHVVDVLAARRFDVDVDVRQLVPERVQEPLEYQVVPDGIDVGDAGQIADERPRRAPSARAPDAHRADVVDDVGDRQEVRRVPELVDHVELVVEPFAYPARRFDPASLDPAPAPLREHRRRRPPGRRRELGEVHPAESEVERAHLLDLERRLAEVRPLHEQPPHLGGRLEPPFGVDAADVVPVDRDELAHALERVGEERVLRHEVPDRVRRDGARPGRIGQPEKRPDLVVGRPLEPLLHPHEESVPERVRERRDRADGGGGPSTDGERADGRGRPQDRDEPVRVRTDLLGCERGLAPLPEHVRVGDQPAGVRVPDVVHGEDDRPRVTDRERGPEYRPDPHRATRVDEASRAVQAVSIGQGDGSEPEAGGTRGELLGREDAVLEREERTNVEMREAVAHLTTAVGVDRT
jgi:hypothetical protein